jgi:hypothetical protein
MQHHSIVQCILATGRWAPADPEPHFSLEPIRVDEVPRLNHLEDDFYINLWAESIFGLPVDGELCDVPHVCAWNTALESQLYPQADPTHHKPPRVLSDKGICFLPKTPD